MEINGDTAYVFELKNYFFEKEGKIIKNKFKGINQS